MSISYGFVFILSCPVMPGVYMLGSSRGSPKQAAEELSLSPAAPADFEVAFYAEVEEPESYLEQVMAQFDEKRVDPDRNYFSVKLIDLIRAIEGDGEPHSTCGSDMATEAKNPGSMWPMRPLWFEENLHSSGYLERLRRGRS